MYFLFAKEGLLNDDVGLARGAVFQEVRPGAGFKTGVSVKEKLGGLHRTTTHLEHVTRLTPTQPNQRSPTSTPNQPNKAALRSSGVGACASQNGWNARVCGSSIYVLFFPRFSSFGSVIFQKYFKDKDVSHEFDEFWVNNLICYE